ncbi:MAG: hypothetical protein IPJ36_16900 [Simplicispira sp.]|nr:hypothetical protein [Simplicispira sp.]
MAVGLLGHRHQHLALDERPSAEIHGLHPLVAIALMQMVVGGSVYLRTDTQLSTWSVQLKANPAALEGERNPPECRR